nr:zinc finger, CCHC-type, retrotransposon Gag domain protein [Tanacetum cinerariifolium]
MVNTQIRDEFRTGSGPSDPGGNPPPVTINTWLERFNKQKPRSFEKATSPTDTKTSTEFMQHFLRLSGFLRAAAGTAEEQAKNFQWGLR